MLRTYFSQQRFSLSEPQAEEAIYDRESMRRFTHVELGEDAFRIRLQRSPVDRRYDRSGGVGFIIFHCWRRQRGRQLYKKQQLGVG